MHRQGIAITITILSLHSSRLKILTSEVLSIKETLKSETYSTVVGNLFKNKNLKRLGVSKEVLKPQVT